MWCMERGSYALAALRLKNKEGRQIHLFDSIFVNPTIELMEIELSMKSVNQMHR